MLNKIKSKSGFVPAPLDVTGLTLVLTHQLPPLFMILMLSSSQIGVQESLGFPVKIMSDLELPYKSSLNSLLLFNWKPMHHRARCCETGTQERMLRALGASPSSASDLLGDHSF